MKKKEERTEKMMAEVLAENRRLVEPLKSARQRVGELEKQLSNYTADKESLRNTKVQLRLRDDEVKELEWEREVLKQRVADVAERDELYERFVKTIYDVQQKTGFKKSITREKTSSTGRATREERGSTQQSLGCF